MIRIKKNMEIYEISACSSCGVPESAGFLAQRIEEIIQKQFFRQTVFFRQALVKSFHSTQSSGCFLFKNGVKNTDFY